MSVFEKPHGFFSDPSPADSERQELERVLRTALTESKTDAEVEQNIRRLFNHGDALKAQMRWAMLEKLLWEYRRVNDEPSANSRVLAERFLADIPRLYAHR